MSSAICSVRKQQNNRKTILFEIIFRLFFLILLRSEQWLFHHETLYIQRPPCSLIQTTVIPISPMQPYKLNEKC
jgi:hypothetical protein